MEEQMKQRRRAQNLRKHQTKEENHLWYDYLKTYPVQFRRQYQLGCYYVDFYCYAAGLVIELDGSQHCEEEKLRYDQDRTQWLQAQGLSVLRISNLDVMRNFPGVCEKIDEIVRKRIGGK